METFDVSKATKAQEDLQDAKGYPKFAPKSRGH